LRPLRLSENGHQQPVETTAGEYKKNAAASETEEPTAPPERDMLTAVINFGELVVRQVSVPRTEIIGVEAESSILEAVKLAAQHGYTKLPVYETSMDHITGILHLKDLLPVIFETETLRRKTARELAREVLFVPESVSVNHLLVQMRSRRQHMAITLDEFGGTAGLVTLEDLLEEIVGEVQDPFDLDPPSIQQMPDGTAMIDGMAMIEEVNQFFGLELDDPNYDTIAGYILGRMGRIAQVGDVVENPEQGIRLRVETMDRLRIARIRLSRL
jgi:putative hemolysin